MFHESLDLRMDVVHDHLGCELFEGVTISINYSIYFTYIYIYINRIYNIYTHYIYIYIYIFIGMNA